MEFVKPQAKTPAPGREVDAYCARCKLELAHVIIAMNGARIAKAQCKTCRSIHGVRSQPEPRAPRPRTAATARGRLTGSEWDRLTAGRDLSRARRYAPVATFAAGEVVDHPKFGLGVVVKVLSDKKIEVGFETGLKVLVHDRV